MGVNMSASEVLWEPGQREHSTSQMARYLRWLAERGEGDFADYWALYEWSLREPARFWPTVWDYCGLVADTPWEAVTNGKPMPETRWLPGARLNFARNLLRHAIANPDATEAVVAYSETREPMRYSRAQLLDDVGAFEAFLRVSGVNVGDRVAGLVSYGYEALGAMLARTSTGAVW